SDELVSMGAKAVEALRKAEKDPDMEVARRAEDCLKRIQQGSTARLAMAAVRLIAARKPDKAAETLLDYLPFAENEAVNEQVQTALAAVAVREGKSDPALVAALGDKSPLRRGAAALALCRGGAREELETIRKLLDDSAEEVRLRVALGLAVRRD